MNKQKQKNLTTKALLRSLKQKIKYESNEKKWFGIIVSLMWIFVPKKRIPALYKKLVSLLLFMVKCRKFLENMQK